MAPGTPGLVTKNSDSEVSTVRVPRQLRVWLLEGENTSRRQKSNILTHVYAYAYIGLHKDTRTYIDTNQRTRTHTTHSIQIHTNTDQT